MTGLDKDFLDLLGSTIGWSAYTGKDSFGNATYATAEDIPGFVQDILDGFGSEKNDQQPNTPVTEGTVTVSYQPVKVRDKLVVDGQTYYATSITTIRDETGDPIYQDVEFSTEKRG